MSIVAQYPGLCRICQERWEVGEHIGRWLGHEAHFTCRQAEIRRRADEGEATQLPDARGWADHPEMMKPRRASTKYVNIGRISTQDGRDYRGRFASKPEDGSS
jgi:hypothetical protein